MVDVTFYFFLFVPGCSIVSSSLLVSGKPGSHGSGKDLSSSHVKGKVILNR